MSLRLLIRWDRLPVGLSPAANSKSVATKSKSAATKSKSGAIESKPAATNSKCDFGLMIQCFQMLMSRTLPFLQRAQMSSSSWRRPLVVGSEAWTGDIRNA